MTSNLTLNNNAAEVSVPNKGRIGNLPTLSGTLNSLFISGSLYLSLITERLTIMNVTKIRKSVKYATVSMPPTKTNKIASNPTVAIAIPGVLVIW